MKRLYCEIVFVMVLAGCAGREARRTVPDGAFVADFNQRINAYAELRNKLEGGAARLQESRKPEEIAIAEKALGARIVEARATARRGDVFTPAIQRGFRALLNPQLRGLRGQNTRGIIMDENPGEFAFKVNGVYPKKEPLGTIPPNILAALPPLPEDIEYRFINKHLILRDARANLIIDFIPNAIS